jgi:hypothetical protein
MPSRSTRKSAPQIETAVSHDVTAVHVPAWSHEDHFGGLLLKPTSPIDPARIGIHIQGRALTISFGPGKADNKLSAITQVSKRGQKPEYIPSAHRHRFILPETANLKTTKAAWCIDTLTVRFLYADVEAPAGAPPMVDRDTAPLSAVIAIPIDFGKPVTRIIRRKATTVERTMLDQTKSFIQDGIRYYPLSVAAPIVQAPPSTLLDWIKKETKINGQPLRGYYFAPANRHFISEESIERAANRFIKWPSEEPAGPVTLGEKRDQTGYIHLPEAAREIGVHHHTLWRWTTKETRPTDKPLDVIKDPASDQLYIQQKDVSALKKLVPRGGLRAGRRSLPGLQHH